MSFVVVLLYLLSLAFFLLYIVAKIRIKSYLISTFNIGLFVYTFALLVSPIFYVADVSWIGLGIASAISMQKYMNEALKINLIGYIIYISVLFLSEFDNKKPLKIERMGKMIEKSIDNCWIDVFFVVLLIFWYGICAIYCKGIPLFNGKRTFYLNMAISPIYLFLNQTILLSTLYYAIRYVLHKQKLIFTLIGIITITFQGNRAALITNLLLPIIVAFIYKKLMHKENCLKIRENKNLPIKGKRKAVKKLFIALPILVLLGLWMQFLRKGGMSSATQIIFEFLYGNTFSDIRDGAYILKGFHENTDSIFLHGRTYMAALMSFVPSSVSKFRMMWSWGRYTTLGLFGISNHFGLRGGNAMEAYINFGWLGVVVFGVLQGVLGGKLEKIFYRIFIKEDITIMGKEYFVFYMVYLLNSVLVASSSAYNIYSLLVYCFGLILFSQLSRTHR